LSSAEDLRGLAASSLHSCLRFSMEPRAGWMSLQSLLTHALTMAAHGRGGLFACEGLLWVRKKGRLISALYSVNYPRCDMDADIEERLMQYILLTGCAMVAGAV